MSFHTVISDSLDQSGVKENLTPLKRLAVSRPLVPKPAEQGNKIHTFTRDLNSPYSQDINYQVDNKQACY